MTQDPVKDSTTVVQMTGAGQLKDKILALQHSLSNSLPNYEGLLHVIHRNLSADPDIVHLLSDDEIGVICAGLSKKTGIVLAAKDAKKAAKNLKGTTLADL